VGFIGPLVVLGLLVFRPIVYKPLWDTFVSRFEFYEIVSFLSSFEVLVRTTDPYLWVSDSKWRIFLTYLGISSKWRDFLPFGKKPQSTSTIFPLFVLGFIPIFILDEFHPKSETVLHHLVIRARLIIPSRVISDFLVCACKVVGGALVCLQFLFVLRCRRSSFCFHSASLVRHVRSSSCGFYSGYWKCLFIHSGTILWPSKWLCQSGPSMVFHGSELPLSSCSCQIPSNDLQLQTSC